MSNAQFEEMIKFFFPNGRNKSEDDQLTLEKEFSVSYCQGL
jgi:hypothetical protein